MRLTTFMSHLTRFVGLEAKMLLHLLLISSMFLSGTLSFPSNYGSELNNDESKTLESTSSENLLENNDAKSLTVGVEQKKQEDLVGQETFYPGGGVWWGVRPWGGWGGYRPWHGPHWGGHWIGYRPWPGHHWKGSWGGQWGRTVS